MQIINVDSCLDLDYLSMVIMEGLRFQPPVSMTPVVFDQDVTLANKLQVKKGDNVRILNSALHRNPAEWQRAQEFLPERFDPTSPLYLRPDGKQRNSMSWVPWSGGKRICFGKTFAECNLKIIITYMTQFFDFEFVEKEKYALKFPIACMSQSQTPALMIKLTNKKPQ